MAHCQCQPASAGVFIGTLKHSAPGRTHCLESRSRLKSSRPLLAAVAARARNCTERSASRPSDEGRYHYLLSNAPKNQTRHSPSCCDLAGLMPYQISAAKREHKPNLSTKRPRCPHNDCNMRRIEALQIMLDFAAYTIYQQQLGNKYECSLSRTHLAIRHAGYRLSPS